MQQELLKQKENQKEEKLNLKKEIKSLKKHIKSLRNEKKITTNYEQVLFVEQKIDETQNDTIREEDNSSKVSFVKPNKPFSIHDELERMRTTLPELSIGEEVLAKWSDDGWYYRSLVKQSCGDFKYKIEDVNKVSLEVTREDIISESDSENNVLETLDPVVALHPSYSFSYAPGIVIKIANNLSLLVRFYDGVEAIINKEEIYKIPLFKFEYDIDIIVNLEKRWIGQTVIARNPFNFVYEFGLFFFVFFV